jgi:glyoxylate/hydroxypyruvate reductase
MLGTEIRDSTVGIVGFGAIGQTVAKRLSGFDVKKILYSGHREKPEGKNFNADFVPFHELVERSDFIFIICPLTDETRKMFSHEIFGKMKKNCVLINIARGDIVDQDALIDALKSGKIFAAGLDVMSPEPLPSDHELLKLDNCVIIPHLGSATIRTRDDMSKTAALNILNGLSGNSMVYSAF